MRIINIVDKLNSVNCGIWKAAVSTADILKREYNIDSEIWFPETKFDLAEMNTCFPVSLKNFRKKTFHSLIKERKLDHRDTVVITHGVWRFPTYWGFLFKKTGFKWIYIPQGMLEPWCRKQKWLRKIIYFNLFEKIFASKADLVRAVSLPEQLNLHRFFANLVYIPNGIDSKRNLINENKFMGEKIVLFLGRLNNKKGIISLVKGWMNSTLFNNNEYKLIIAGPDDGEKKKLSKILASSSEIKNIEYIGSVYNDKKNSLLSKSAFFILPSQSEGFSSSVLEAMSFGLIPIITDGCNFPEAFKEKLAIHTTPLQNDIINSLDILTSFDNDNLVKWSRCCQEFVLKNYTLEKVASLQAKTYQRLLKQPIKQ